MQGSRKKATGTIACFFGALALVILVMGLVPFVAFADAKATQFDSSPLIFGQDRRADSARSTLLGAQDDEALCNSVSIPTGVPTQNGEGEDVVYISISHDGSFVESDGANSNVTMANVEIPISAIAGIQLSEYGLENYAYQVDGVDQVTVLHLYLYVLENYYSNAAEDFVVSGDPGSLFITQFWGFEPGMNFTYYVNGEYPLQYVGWGATADEIILRPGLHVDVAHFTNMGFFSDPDAGHCYFFDASEDISREAITLGYSGFVGEPIELGVLRAGASMSVNPGEESYDTSYYAVEDQGVYCAASYKADDMVLLGTTDGDGIISTTFNKPGTYCVWVDGLVSDDYGAVSGPAMATVTVLAAPVAPTLADGVEAAIEASFELGEAYEVDLSAIFADANGDSLTYKVKVDDAEAVEAVASYGFTPEAIGTYTLVFTANDGTADSADTYTVTLVVKPSKASLRALVESAGKADVEAADDVVKIDLAAKLEAANEVVGKADATEQEISGAENDLSTALQTALDSAMDNAKDALEQAIVEATAANVADASPEAQQVLAAAIQEAEVALANGSLTAGDFAALKSALFAALKTAVDEQAAADKRAAADRQKADASGLPVGSTFTVKDAGGTWTYKVTAAKRVMLTKAIKTKKKGKATINTVAYKGVFYSVKAIGAKALKGSQLASIVVGDNVESIGARAFAGSKNLKKFTAGRNVAKIGAKAFAKAKKLKKIAVKSAMLTTSASVKGSLKGSKVKTVLVQVGSAKANKKCIKKYRKLFTKKVCGRKANVK